MSADQVRHRRAMIVAGSLMAVLGAPLTLQAQTPAPWTTHPVAIVELRSYGEQPQDMIELLVPFVANLGFTAAVSSKAITQARISRAFLRLMDGDLVGLQGADNCIVVEYFVTRPSRPLHGGPTEKERTQTFRNSLSSFLDGLPTPRLAVKYLDAGATFCTRAP